MAGSFSEGMGLQSAKRMHVSATLGFHAPFILPKKETYTREEVIASYQLGMTAVSRLLSYSSQAIYNGPLRTTVIPNEVLKQMLTKGPDEFYKVDTAKKANQLSIKLVGHRQLL